VYDGAGESIGQMDGVVDEGAFGGALTPQGKTANGHAQANSAVKREELVDDSDVSEFTPDFM
jgi:hypothetical protein